MSTRRLNIPALGFDVIVVGSNGRADKIIAEMVEKGDAIEECLNDCACVGCSEGECCDHGEVPS